jgi:hypothetical protein
MKYKVKVLYKGQKGVCEETMDFHSLAEATSVFAQWRYASNCIKCEVLDLEGNIITMHENKTD